MKVRILPLPPLAAFCVFACIAAASACSLPGARSHPAPPSVAAQASDVACPDGKPARPGLSNFGAYIGTWQSTHVADARVATDYAIPIVPGRMEVRCSAAGYVITEMLHPRDQVPAGLALRLALSDLPDDARKIYDHVHAGCRGLQYESTKLAHQLGRDDVDGHVGITFESETRAYNAASITTIRLDLVDVLGADTRLC